MKLLKFAFRVFLFCFLPMQLYAQVKSDRYKPKWLTKEVPMQNDAYLFERAYGDGQSLDEARLKCFVNLTTKLEHERGITVSSKFKASSHLSRDIYTKNKDFTMDCEENGKAIFLNCRAVDEYWTNDRGHYGCSLLYSIANTAYPDISKGDMAYVTASYVSDPATWGLALIPGAAQFHKGSYLKGGLLLGGTVALVGGIIFTENQRADYVNKIAKTHDADIKRAYATKRDHFATGRNICIGAVAALYVYNLIDAIIAPGARRVVVQKRPNGSTYAFTPAILDGNTPGMAVAMTF